MAFGAGSGRDDFGSSVVMQADGKIVVGGFNLANFDSVNSQDCVLARLNADGTLDAGFGTSGVVIRTISGGQQDAIYGIALQADGKIVTTGPAGAYFFMERFNPDGTLDINNAGGPLVGTSGLGVKVQPDGKIVAAGYAHNGSNLDFVVARFIGDPVLTEPPTLTAPASDSLTGSPVNVSFSLPGAALPGSVKLSFGSTVLTLAASQETSGAHSFSFNPANPTAAPQIASGTDVFDGVYTVTLSYRDIHGNPPASDVATVVAIDTAGPQFGTVSAPAVLRIGQPWSVAFLGWGDAHLPLSYRVDVDGLFTGTPSSSSFQPQAPLSAATHSYTLRGRIFDVLGNETVVSRTLTLRPPVPATIGMPDLPFGNGGKVTKPVGGGNDIGKGVKIGGGGKVIVVGGSDNGTDNDFAIVRHNPDGSPDTSFGNGGAVTTPIGSGDDEATSVVEQSDGKIIVVGHSDNGSNDDIALVRLNPDGTLDTTFGSGGKVTTDFAGSDDAGNSVVVLEDGKILVVGVSNGNFVIVRYNADGTLDTTFGIGGRVSIPIGTGSEAFSVVVQPDGKIVVTGSATVGGNADFALVRLNADGTLDTSFGTGGKVTTAIGSGSDEAFSVALQEDGKLVVAGQSTTGGNADFALVRFKADGTLDTDFGTGGKVTTAIGTGNDIGRSVVVQSDGRIVVAGDSVIGGNTDVALVRFNSNGTLDPSFGSGGKTTVAIGTGNDVGAGVVLQSDGTILVAGTSTTGGNADFALVSIVAQVFAEEVSNGGFEDGDSGFGSSFTFVAGTSSTAGTYSIKTNPQQFNAGLASFGDHTTGTGNMMVVDGRAGDVWQQSVVVQPQTWYRFSAWAASTRASSPAQLALSANAATLPSAQVTLPATPGVWVEGVLYWFSGASTTATLRIRDLNTETGIGNDFALDDISMQAVSAPANASQLDTVAPVVSLSTPAAGTVAPTFSITGTVKENFALASFTVSLNGVAQTLTANPMSGFAPDTNLPFSVTGVQTENGTNTIVVEAIDAVGRTTRVTRTVIYVNPALAGRAGTYMALLRATGAPDNNTTGLVTVTLKATGVFTGKIRVGAVSVAFSGVLGNNGAARFKPSLGATFDLIDRTEFDSYLGAIALSVTDPAGLNGTLSTEASSGSTLATFAGKATVTTATPGLYNVAFPSKTQTPPLAKSTYPQGEGFARAKVTAAGAVAFVGFLADGVKCAVGTKLRTDGSVALFAPLYRRLGAMAGEMTFADLTDTDVSGTDFTWLRPASPLARYYRNGWPNGIKVDAAGTVYLSPASLNFGQGASDLTLGNASLVFTDGALSSTVTRAVNVDPTTGAVRLIPATNTTYKLGLKADSGVFSGTFIHTDATANNYRGILLNKGANKGGFGFFLSTPQLRIGEAGQGGRVFLDSNGP